MKSKLGKQTIGKKSQTTFFMLAGIIILLGGIIFYYATKQVAEKPEPEIRIVQEQIPFEFDSIRKYANDCAYAIGVEGLRLIGDQGGYISFTNKNLNRESFVITKNPTESDAVSFAQDSELKVPYWWYLKSINSCTNDCKLDSKRPELRQADNSIEKQLERYLNSRFKDCLNNFEPFVEQGFKITEAGKINSDVTISSGDVLILVEFPINMEKQDTKSKVSQFNARVPVNLEKIYDLATKITNMEIKHRYLEKHIINLLVAFSGVNREKLPPMSELQFKFGSSTSWQKSDVKNKITGLLSSYIPLFQVDGTYNYERNLFESEVKQRLYDSTIIPVANSSFSDLEAHFTYLDFWPVYFDLNCRGERCIPSSANSLISFFGIQSYRFTYDISFPVLVRIKDPFALNNQGYSFSFFLEGNIRNNKPMPADFTPLERASISERSQLCEVKTSGNISVTATNAATKKPVDDAQVLYTLIDESCFIGATNSDGLLIETFPIGVGGIVNTIKDGYIGRVVEFDPQVGKDDELNVEMQPIYTKNLIVKKKNIVKTGEAWQFVDMPVDLNNKETASITLNRINDENELEFSSVAAYEGQQTEASTIDIAPGDYAADITLMLNERIVIPEKQKCVRKNIFGEKECYTIPKVDFGEGSSPGQERFPEGGLKLNITISPNDLEKYDTIVIYVLSVDVANIPEQDRVIEDINEISKIEEYSSTYQLALQPTFQ